jgi:hypothetical protein
VDYFLFPTLKRGLAGITMTFREFKRKWEGVIKTPSKDDLRQCVQEVAAVLKKVPLYKLWIHREKLENKFFDNLNIFHFICLLHFVPECTPYK